MFDTLVVAWNYTFSQQSVLIFGIIYEYMMKNTLFSKALLAFIIILLFNSCSYSIPTGGRFVTNVHNNKSGVGLLMAPWLGVVLGLVLPALIGVAFLLVRNKKQKKEQPLIQLHFPKTTHGIIKRQTFLDVQVEQGIMHLNHVNKLGYLKMLERNNVEVKMLQSDAVEFIQDVYKSFKSISDMLNVEFNLISQTENVVMDFDKDLLMITLGNLFSLAFEKLDSPYRITTEVSYKENQLILKITKHGFEVDVPELVELIEDESILSKTSPTNCHIKLKTTAMLAQLMGGKLELAESINGLVHIIRLPSTNKAPTDSEEKMLNATEYWRKYLDTLNQFKVDEESKVYSQILVVDKSVETAALTSFCLGAEVDIFHTSSLKDASAYIKERPPHIIICRTVLNEGSSIGLCKEIKSESKTSLIPIILISSESNVDEKIKAFAMGVDVYLEKPINYKELVIRIQQLLSQRKQLKELYTFNQPNIKFDFDNDAQIEDEFILKAKAIIDDNLFDPQFGLQLFSSKLKMSQSQLRRKVFSLTGLTPVRFIRQYRIKIAIDLLKSQSLNISQIAYDTGFSDPKYFSRVFTKEVGLSPSEFKSQFQRKLVLS
jgi:AraC-like DNA-binding protein/CheY-like chemotaxis protein